MACRGESDAAMIDLDTQYFEAADGVRIAWRELGAGRPIVLLHGFFSDAVTNWLKFAPTASTIADAGFRVIMPDLRAHGLSDRPHDPAAYPLDVLADDQFALIAALGLTDYDLAGYSLGGRTVARLLARGAKPGRAIIAGMGLEGLIATERRRSYFRRVLTKIGQHEQGSPEWLAEAFLKTSGGDPVALNLLLDSFVDTPQALLAAIDVPVGIICGVDDFDNGSAADLAAIIPGASLMTVPGNHMSAVTKSELGQAMLAFLQKGR
jgi:pimeloyl-ACP methyl ester carboxylesterase